MRFWFPIFLLALICIIVFIGMSAPMYPSFTKWLDKWQNLTAAILAIIASMVAYYGVTIQINQNDKLERNRRDRKLAAIRATLPLALSQIVEYAQNSAHALEFSIASVNKEKIQEGTLPHSIIVPLPKDTVTNLGQFIEFSDEIDVSLVEKLVAWIQIHDARVRGHFQDNHNGKTETLVLRTNIEGSIIDAVTIFATASSLFDYARHRGDKPPLDITWENVYNALGNLRMWDQDHPRIYKIIEGRKKTTKGPYERLS